VAYLAANSDSFLAHPDKATASSAGTKRAFKDFITDSFNKFVFHPLGIARKVPPMPTPKLLDFKEVLRVGKGLKCIILREALFCAQACIEREQRLIPGLPIGKIKCGLKGLFF
jgi:hypothetical protein